MNCTGRHVIPKLTRGIVRRQVVLAAVSMTTATTVLPAASGNTKEPSPSISLSAPPPQNHTDSVPPSAGRPIIGFNNVPLPTFTTLGETEENTSQGRRVVWWPSSSTPIGFPALRQGMMSAFGDGRGVLQRSRCCLSRAGGTDYSSSSSSPGVSGDAATPGRPPPPPQEGASSSQRPPLEGDTDVHAGEKCGRPNEMGGKASSSSSSSSPVRSEDEEEQAIVAAQEKAAAEEASSSDEDDEVGEATRLADARKITPGAKQHCLSPNAVVPPKCVVSPEPSEVERGGDGSPQETIVIPTPIDGKGSSPSTEQASRDARTTTTGGMSAGSPPPPPPPTGRRTCGGDTASHSSSTVDGGAAGSESSSKSSSSSSSSSRHHTTPAAPETSPKKKVVTDRTGENIPIWRVVKLVWTYLWPKGQWKMKALVVSSVTCVLTAKVLKVMLPFTFKAIIDALTPAVAVTSAAGGSAVATVEGAAALTTTAAAAAEAVAVTTLGPLTLTACGFVVAYGLCRVAGSISEEFKNVFFAPVGGAGSTNLAMQMIRKMHDLDLPFHLNRETGVLSKDLDRGSRAFWNLAYLLLFMVVPTAFEMALVGTALCTQGGGPFVSIAAVAVVAYIAWTLVITNWRAKFRARFNRYDSRVGGRIVDSLLNYETVKYFGSEAYECARIEKEVKKMNRQLVILDQSIALLNVGQQLIFAVASVGSLYMATCGVLMGTMTVGDLVLVDGLLLQLYMPLSYLGMIYRDIQSSTQNMQAMIALMDSECIVKDPPDAKPYVHQKGTIEFRNVSFEYSTIKKSEEEKEVTPIEGEKAKETATGGTSQKEEVPAETNVAQAPSLPTKRRLGVLHKVNLNIPGGSVVAFVGASGSGKSTIFRLLFRFFNPTEGTVLLDGQPIHQLQMKSVRKHIGVIPQDPILFNQSIRYNICYSKPSATMEEVERVARLANLHDTIMALPDGYETGVGERGCKLSGGEKQRVAIARALLDDRPILLADEATSALDTATEAGVMKALRARTQSGRPRTVLLIAHRLTTVKEADIIFVLGDGGVAECGGHDELLATNGIYARLWHRQLEEKEKEQEQVAKAAA